MIDPAYSSLLHVERLVQYCSSIWDEEYIGRIFFVTNYQHYPRNRIAYVIPEYSRKYITDKYTRPRFKWQAARTKKKEKIIFSKFDHMSSIHRAFNFGPITPKQIEEFIIPGAEPFVIHEIKQSCNRIKLSHSGYSYYYYADSKNNRRLHWDLFNEKGLADTLPNFYKEKYLNSIKHCESYK